MRRRRYVQVSVGAAVGLAGCTGSGDPEYGGDISTDDLVLPERAVSDGWTREDADDDAVDVRYVGSAERLFVSIRVTKFDSADAAAEEVETVRGAVGDTESLDVGDESFVTVRSDRSALAVVRDGNALGRVTAEERASGRTEPDISVAADFAESLFEHWQSLQ